VVWFFPDRYERAMADPAWRRGFFQLSAQPSVHCLRAIEFAADAWPLLRTYDIPPFSLDGHRDLREAAAVVFWAPDVLTAARIPSILARLGLTPETTRVGVVVSGWSAPRFLRGHVDWILPAPSGWLPSSIIDLLARADASLGEHCYVRTRDNRDRVFSGAVEPISLLAYNPAATPQWIARVDAGTGMSDIDLFEVGQAGALVPRTVPTLVADAQASLTGTGLDGLRFCDSGFDCADTVAATLIELSRVQNMKRVQVELPPISPDDYEMRWQAYKPHLIKPVLRLRLRADHDPAKLIELGRRALNDGWHALTLVLTFDSYACYAEILPIAQEVVRAWVSVASGFADKRPLRLEFLPAPVDLWLDPPSEPSEAEYRRLSSQCRRFRETTTGSCSFEDFRIEDIIARNWLAAADIDLWPRLAEVDLAGPNDENAAPFDWCDWVRTRSGLDRAPSADFSRRTGSPVPPAVPPTDTVPTIAAPAAPRVTGEGQIYGRRRTKPGFTRRLSAPNRTRLRVRWGKTDEWRFYSHLDMVRTLERAIRISGLPAAYSEGFHPRLRLSFGPPLAFGLTSRAELFDLILERGVEPSDVDLFRRALPQGVFIEEGKGMPEQMPSLSESVNEASYSALIPLEPMAAQMAIQETLSRRTIEWTRTDKPERKPVDPRNSLKTTAMEITPEGVLWTITVALGGSGSVRPTDWIALIFGFDTDKIAGLTVERTDLLIRRGERTRSAFDFP
jgi:radical SAM-linked protein